jgi:hypothetical protein
MVLLKLLTAQGLVALATDRSTKAFTQVLTDLAFVPPTMPQSDQGRVVARLSPARTPEDAMKLRQNRFTLLDTMIPVGELHLPSGK